MDWQVEWRVLYRYRRKAALCDRVRTRVNAVVYYIPETVLQYQFFHSMSLGPMKAL